MDKIDDIARRRKEARTELQSLGSKVYDAFLHMEATALADGAPCNGTSIAPHARARRCVKCPKRWRLLS